MQNHATKPQGLRGGKWGQEHNTQNFISDTSKKKMDRNIKTVAQFYTYYYMVKKYITTTINKAFYPEKKDKVCLWIWALEGL